VFYMGVTTAKEWTSKLIANGKSPDTPVALVRRCSLPDQQVIRCRLDQVVGKLTPYSKFPPPVICIVGKVTDEELCLNWFADQALYGQTVLVTRAAHQAAELGGRLTEQGAGVFYQPAISIDPVEDWQKADDAIARLSKFDWIVFTSANGVTVFLDRMISCGHDLRRLGSLRIAAIGASTAKALKKFHLIADLVPEEFRAESLAAELVAQSERGKCLVIRASRGREVLVRALQDAGSAVDQLVVYNSNDVEQLDAGIEKSIAAGQIDWVTVTSSAIARSLAKLIGKKLNDLKLVSISPVTSATLRELGFEPAAEAREFTMDGVVEAIVSHGDC
jgi:uroporphyrinogen III methyltransferase/synthase